MYAVKLSSFLFVVFVFAFVCYVASPTVQGAMIAYTRTSVDLDGQGFGNVRPILTLQAHDNNDSEWGAVDWNGSADVFPSDSDTSKSPKTQTFSVADLLDLKIDRDHFGLVLNINEDSDNEIQLDGFLMNFYHANGALAFSATYLADDEDRLLSDPGNGQGTAGLLFYVLLSQTEFDSFFNNVNNRIGLCVPQNMPLQNVSGGGESFLPLSVRFDPNLPEPMTLATLLLGLPLLRRRR